MHKTLSEESSRSLPSPWSSSSHEGSQDENILNQRLYTAALINPWVFLFTNLLVLLVGGWVRAPARGWLLYWSDRCHTAAHTLSLSLSPVYNNRLRVVYYYSYLKRLLALVSGFGIINGNARNADAVDTQLMTCSVSSFLFFTFFSATSS